MPIQPETDYLPSFFCRNAHLHTILPLLFRKIRNIQYKRERITTSDDDFLDCDWSRAGSQSLAILSHGLEGDSRRPYILGMVKMLNEAKIDTLSWNFRGCSGEINRKPRFTHSGATEDLATVIDHVLERTDYENIFLVGFSIGGNLTLKYLGERKSNSRIKKAIAISVPCELESAAHVLAQPSCKIYMIRFLIQLRQKMKALSQTHQGKISLEGYRQLRNFLDFDARYTAPLHGFRSAQDYWRHSSSKYYMKGISIPTLLLNAKDDPFLSAECFPHDEAQMNPNLFLQIPRFGGHVGFVAERLSDPFWSEKRTLEFLLTNK